MSRKAAWFGNRRLEDERKRDSAGSNFSAFFSMWNFDFVSEIFFKMSWNFWNLKFQTSPLHLTDYGSRDRELTYKTYDQWIMSQNATVKREDSRMDYCSMVVDRISLNLDERWGFYYLILYFGNYVVYGILIVKFLNADWIVMS